MQQIEEGFKEIAAKLVLFIPGLVIGVALKMSHISKRKKLTMKIALYEILLAMGAFWVVWWGCEHYHVNDFVKALAVFGAGRFGDVIILYTYKAIVLLAKFAFNEIKKQQ